MNEAFTKRNTVIAASVSWSVALLIVIYFITLVLGMLSLNSPQDPIGNPYFTILELLILFLAPLMVITIAFVHIYSPVKQKIYSLLALIFMSIMASITCSLHFIVLTVSHHQEFVNLTWSPLIFSFNWPSIVYTLDVLAWDVFFAFSMLFASAIFRKKGLERVIRVFLILSGTISLIGLIGIPFNNMQLRNIGIIGYTVFAIVTFSLFGLAFIRKSQQ